MKGPLIIAIFLFASCHQAKQGPTTISFAKSVNLDTLTLNRVKEFSIIITNTGPNSLKINDIQVPCSCTKPYWDRQFISPGENAKVDIQFTPGDLGAFTEEIQLSGNFETSYIRITGYVDSRNRF